MKSGGKRTDWRKRFGAAKAPHIVTLPSDFAGVKAGSTMLISSPGDIADYIARIPVGQRRTVARMRSDLASRAGVSAMCPVTTAIYLRIVAEVALEDIETGKDLSEVVPFWRILTSTDKITDRISCGREGLANLQALEAAGTENQPSPAEEAPGS